MTLPSLAQLDRFADLVERLEPMSAAERERELAALDGSEEAAVVELVRLHFRLPREEEWACGREALPGYTLCELLGRGGFGEVWRARKKSGFEVALKAIPRRDVRMLGLELRAVGLMRAVRHPHLLALIDLHETRSRVVLECELASGTLADRLARVRADGLPGIPPSELLSYMDDAAEAVDFLNLKDHPLEGGSPVRIQHRDLKPGNLLLQGGRVKVGDFGIAKALSADATRHTGALSPPYAPPEALAGRTEPQSDQYSLAACYAELRTGRLAVPPDLSGLCDGEAAALAKALCASPKDRYGSCKELVEELRRSLQHGQTPTEFVPGLAPGGGAPVPEGLRSGLQSFTAFVSDRARGFLGRDHVFSELDRFVEGSPSGYFIVRGHPGMGKSAIAARLVETRGLVHHFNVAAQSITRTDQFLGNVCARLILRFGLPYRELPGDARESPRFLNQLLDESARKLPPGERLLLVVDALDEADGAATPAANALLLPGSLPERVFVVATTRPLDASDPRRLTVSRPHYLDLDGAAEWNRRDVVCFIGSFLPSEGVQTWAEKRGLGAAAFTELVAERSEGNFMYLRHVLEALARGEMAELGVADLPQGLKEYYERHWRMMRGADPRHFDEVLRPVICVLAAVREPVTLDLAADVTGVPIAQVERALRRWREFLFEERGPQRERLYRVYHQSFREYLEDEVDPGLRTYRRMIAEAGARRTGGASEPAPPRRRRRGP